MPDPSDTTHPRARDAAATRTLLLRAAKRRFTLAGFDRTTSRDIAGDAGVNVSLINRYFGSKDGLFEAVLQETADSLEGVQAVTAADLVAQLADSLAPDAWPEFGHEHPLRLLLRDTASDERTARLRRRTLSATIGYFADVLGREGDDPAETRVRAGLLFAIFAGVITMRDLLPDEPFASLEPADLARRLDAVARSVAE